MIPGAAEEITKANSRTERWSRGFLAGTLLGAFLIAFGLGLWALFILIGFEKDTSTAGMWIGLPLYALSLGFGGAVINGLIGRNPTWVTHSLAWIAGIAVAFGGITLAVLQILHPIAWYWGLPAPIILITLAILSLRRSRDHLTGGLFGRRIIVLIFIFVVIPINLLPFILTPTPLSFPDSPCLTNHPHPHALRRGDHARFSRLRPSLVNELEVVRRL